MADLALFDFDKTLVAGDSFRLFAQLATPRLAGRARLFALAAAYKIGLLTNGAYKARVLQRVWLPMGEAERQAHQHRFHAALRRREQVAITERMRTHLRCGDTVAILSASPRFYLLPFVKRTWPAGVDVYGSDVRVEGGRVRVEALYGEQKRTLARRLIQEHAQETVWAYTDHRSDLPLLKLADRAVLVNPARAFRRTVDAQHLPYEVIEP